MVIIIFRISMAIWGCPPIVRQKRQNDHRVNLCSSRLIVAVPFSLTSQSLPRQALQSQSIPVKFHQYLGTWFSLQNHWVLRDVFPLHIWKSSAPISISAHAFIFHGWTMLNPAVDVKLQLLCGIPWKWSASRITQDKSEPSPWNRQSWGIRHPHSWTAHEKISGTAGASAFCVRKARSGAPLSTLSRACKWAQMGKWCEPSWKHLNPFKIKPGNPKYPWKSMNITTFWTKKSAAGDEPLPNFIGPTANMVSADSAPLGGPDWLRPGTVELHGASPKMNMSYDFMQTDSDWVCPCFDPRLLLKLGNWETGFLYPQALLTRIWFWLQDTVGLVCCKTPFKQWFWGASTRKEFQLFQEKASRAVGFVFWRSTVFAAGWRWMISKSTV